MSMTSSVRVEWIAAVTIAAGTVAIGYLAYRRFYVKDHRNKSMVNPHIQKDHPKDCMNAAHSAAQSNSVRIVDRLTQDRYPHDLGQPDEVC
ncbi:hypothetical protein MG293_009124 [Ovis ammon polii]|uniref:Iron sulphur domain-containing protein n=1 Tax=Ovis ammon polii TaxID=230172 RepID=A0AAD4U606_OVIAM|nr:hypothetical protein MG293_009124 [Ovis ammon polii]